MNPSTIVFFIYLLMSSFFVIIANPAMKGPAFLISYLIYVVITVFVSKTCKWKPILPLIFIELVGLCRIFYGLRVGMSQFNYLLMTMLISFIIYFSRSKSIKSSIGNNSTNDGIDTSDSDGCSSCSSCSGCGGCGDD